LFVVFALAAVAVSTGARVVVAWNFGPKFVTLTPIGDEPNAAGTASVNALCFDKPMRTEARIQVACTGLTPGKTYLVRVGTVGVSKSVKARSNGHLQISDTITCGGWEFPFPIQVQRLESGSSIPVLQGDP
jgi:hypothetical protein